MENNYTDLFKSRSSGLEIQTGYRLPLKLVQNNPTMNLTEVPRKPRHIENALNLYNGDGKEFITIENINDVHAVVPVVSFKIQSDPISEVGVNGIQASDMLLYVKCLFQSLNDAFPCKENQYTINAIDNALGWQCVRTQDRLKRQVEGYNKV